MDLRSEYALLDQDYVNYIIVIHGGRNNNMFVVPRALDGSPIAIKYLTSQLDPGNYVTDPISRQTTATGNCLLVGRETIDDVCNSTFQPAEVIRSDNPAHDIGFGLGEALPIQFGIYKCYNGERPISPFLLWDYSLGTTGGIGSNLQDPTNSILPAYATLEGMTNFIVRLHGSSNESGLPMAIIPASCSVSKFWNPSMTSQTPTSLHDSSIKDRVDDISDAFSFLNVDSSMKSGGSKRKYRSKRKRSKRKSNRSKKRFK